MTTTPARVHDVGSAEGPLRPQAPHNGSRPRRSRPRLATAVRRLLDATAPSARPGAAHSAVVDAVVHDLGFLGAALHVHGESGLSLVTSAGDAGPQALPLPTPQVLADAVGVPGSERLWVLARGDGPPCAVLTFGPDEDQDAVAVLVVRLGPHDRGQEGRPLGPARADQLTVLGRQAALVLGTVGPRSPAVVVRRGVDDRMRQQAAVAELGQAALSPSGTLRSVFEEAARTAAVTLDVPLVVLVERDGDIPRVAAAYGLAPDAVLPDAAARSIWQAITNAAAPADLPDVAELPSLVHSAIAELGLDVASATGVRVGSPRTPWGVLCAFGEEEDCFDPDDLHFLRGVANVVAAAQARFRAEEEVRHRALHDALTGLPNRDLLNARLEAALASSLGPHRTSPPPGGGRTALLLLDLDGFKDVNDSQGHQAGDEVLRQVARRLTERLGPQATVARLGGDEFAVVLDRIDGPAAAATAAADLVAVLREPFESPSGGVCLGGSIGVALAPEHGTQPFGLLQRADLAMYRAKRERIGFALHDPAIDEDAGERLARIAELRAAIAARQVTVAFQPIVDLVTHEVTSVEALARWHHPTRGWQEPTDFVGLAEQNGLVADLTDVVLHGAVQQCAAWMRRGRGLPVAVNMSPAVLAAPSYADDLRRVTYEAGLPPHLLRIEVTETTLASEAAVKVLHRIKAHGIRVAIDDFGTGYSSLGRLKQLPVQTLKIDRSFIIGLADDKRDVAIVRSIVALAGELGLRVVAEGVENVEAARLLPQIGVTRAQGNLFSPPVDVAGFESWYDRWQRGERGCCVGRTVRV